MAVDGVIARISGIVTYSDGSVEQFSAHIDEAENLSENYRGESQSAISQAAADNDYIENMLALLPGTTTITPNAPESDRTVTDVVAEFSGRTSYDDETWGDFIVQFSFGSAFVPSGGTTDNQAWTDAVGYSTTLANLTAVLQAVVDGTVSIA